MGTGDFYKGTFCPGCGVGIAVDEDGCCLNCGADAVGIEVDKILNSLTSFRARAEKAEAERDALASRFNEARTSRDIFEHLLDEARTAGIMMAERLEKEENDSPIWPYLTDDESDAVAMALSWRTPEHEEEP